MPTIYAAVSASLSKWGADVGLSRHLYKIGRVDGDRASIIADWARLSDWKIVKTRDCPSHLAEATIIERLAAKNKLIDPGIYPRIRGMAGFFKILPAQVENYLTLSRALAGAPIDGEAKLKPTDFADYLFHTARLDSPGAAALEGSLEDIE